jgi:hypothetical protein
MTQLPKKLSQILEEHGNSKSRLAVKTFTTSEDENSPSETYVLLQGERESLQFLAEMIMAHLNTDTCNFSIHPSGAGSTHFSHDSTVGIYLHRLPCSEDPPQVM